MSREKKEVNEVVSVGTLIASIVGSVFASTGFWTLITYLIQRRDQKESAQAKMLKGLGHDRICWLAKEYIERGYITVDEYENLNDYLFEPYKKLGGNGTAEMLMEEVKKLPKRTQKGAVTK